MFVAMLEQWQPFIILFCLSLFLLWETVTPFFRTEGRLRHVGMNLVIASLNAVVLALLFSGLIVWVAEEASTAGFGLLRLLPVEGSLLIVLGFLALDVWTYWWHRLNHRVPFLWRFHRMHHSDPTVDVTTATRFHVGEIILSSVMRIALVPLIGIPIESVILFDVIQLPIIAFHHANISVSKRTDRLLCYVLVTPFMHKVHHSRKRSETDSNYSSVLSVWDRVFRSFVQKDEYRTIRFGLDGFDGPEDQSLAGLFRTPLIEKERS